MSQEILAPADRRSLGTRRFSRLVTTAGIYILALIFLLIGLLLQATGIIRGFLNPQNFLNIVDNISLLGIVAVGMAFVTYSGHYADLSVPTTMSLTGIVAIELLRFGFWPGVLGAVAVGLLIGLINAIAVGRFKANPIIWTLAVSYVTMGVIRLVWVNKQIYPDMKAGTLAASRMFDAIYRLEVIRDIGGSPLLDIRLPMFLMLVLIIAGQWVLTRTRFGVQLKFTGASRRTARFTGIDVERIVGLAFLVASFTAALGGLTVTSLSRVGAWYNGAGYDFRAVTAVVIGGMTLAGGRGNIIGVLGGVLVIGLINNIMTLLGISTLAQDMVRGIIFILAVGIQAKSLRSLGRDDT